MRSKHVENSTIIVIKMEKRLSRQDIFEGKVIRVAKDKVSLDDGTIASRELVFHNGGVCIALKDDDKYFMVRQYRYALGKEMLEFPAGKIEKDEEPDEAIEREVIEETGYKAKDIIKLGKVIPTCGYDNEKIYLYYGLAGENVGQHFDADERINVEKYTFKEIKEMIKNNTIDDSKTIALMYRIELEGLDA